MRASRRSCTQPASTGSPSMTSAARSTSFISTQPRSFFSWVNSAIKTRLRRAMRCWWRQAACCALAAWTRKTNSCASRTVSMPMILSPNLRGVPLSVSSALKMALRFCAVNACSSSAPLAEKLGALARPRALADAHSSGSIAPPGASASSGTLSPANSGNIRSNGCTDASTTPCSSASKNSVRLSSEVCSALSVWKRPWVSTSASKSAFNAASLLMAV